MNIWTINNNELEVGTLTVLKGYESEWFIISRQIESFFNDKNSNVELKINELPVNKNDWECILLPYDNQFSLDKVTTKSPLKKVQNEVLEYLKTSLLCLKLEEDWEELKEEIQLFNISNEKYKDLPLLIKLQDFDLQMIMDRLIFKSKYFLNPSSFKLVLLKLIALENPKKRRLIIIEAPEIFSSKDEQQEITKLIELLVEKGNIIFVVSQSNKWEGIYNYYIKNRIVNSFRLEGMYNEIKDDVPFLLDKEDYQIVKNELLLFVDNDNKKSFELFISNRYPQLCTAAYLVCEKIGIPITIDLSVCPSNIIYYLTSKGYGNKLEV